MMEEEDLREHVMEEEGYRELFYLQRFDSGKCFPFFISRFSGMELTSLHLIGNELRGIINSGIFFVLLFYLSFWVSFSSIHYNKLLFIHNITCIMSNIDCIILILKLIIITKSTRQHAFALQLTRWRYTPGRGPSTRH